MSRVFTKKRASKPDNGEEGAVIAPLTAEQLWSRVLGWQARREHSRAELEAKGAALDSTDKAAAKDHPSYALVHDWANDWTSAEDLRELLTADALLTGHGFAQVIRNDAGRPLELHRMDPGAVVVEHDDFGEPSYRVRLTGGGAAGRAPLGKIEERLGCADMVLLRCAGSRGAWPAHHWKARASSIASTISGRSALSAVSCVLSFS